MDYATYEIGKQCDEHGEPLVIVDGKLFGTIVQVRALLDRYERESAIADALAIYDVRVAPQTARRAVNESLLAGRKLGRL